MRQIKVAINGCGRIGRLTFIIGNPHFCIFDSSLTSVKQNLVKVIGWYDNESRYLNRLVDLVHRVGR